jgi:hypothetical protein
MSPGVGTGFVALAVVGVMVAAAEAPVGENLPPTASAILLRMENEIAASKLRAIVGLEKVLKDTTKKGDLGAAVAIKAEIDRLKAETEAAKSRDRISFVGTWRANDSATTFEVFPDGRVVNQGGVKGRWTASASQVEIHWENGLKVVVRPSGTNFVGQRTLADGTTTAVLYSRVGAP